MSKVMLLAGTRKGAFIYTSDEARHDWKLSKPIMPGWSVAHLAVDARHNPARLLAAANHWAWGVSVAWSDDEGETWEERSPGLGFPQDMGISIQRLWNVRPGHPDEPGAVYVGTQPAGLFRSEDWGQTWAPVETLNRHPYREFWRESGGGESCLHSIEIDPRDPKRMYVSISTGGTYVTNDGGQNWQISSHRVVATTGMSKMAERMIAEFMERFPDLAAELATRFPPLPPNVDPAAADEFHKLRIDPKRPDRLWGQAHIGVFRLDEGQGGWKDMTEGLPSFHGFPIAITRNVPDAVFVVPLEFQDNNVRVCAGQLTIYRTRDAGATWEPLTNGLPGPNDYQSVYREGMDTDGLSPEGVYVGTSNGQVYASKDCGDTWHRLPGTLPPVLSVTAVRI